MFTAENDSTPNDKLLIAAMEKVKSSLTQEAKEHHLDQNIGKETELELQEINFFPKEPVFLCPQGSVVRNNACREYWRSRMSVFEPQIHVFLQSFL